ncbi:MAG: hypothetical protein E7638_04110 [Ruminococcaceae bacterium]|nr:hypothetical protein [Oscillospiraceae bacterium]
MKKVVLLDDPINFSYRERVKELLSDIAEVAYFEGVNGYSDALTWRAKSQFETWENWNDIDLVYWSTGLWDHRRTLDDGEPLITAEQYLHYNRRLHRQLTRHAKHLVFATVTPAGEGYKYDPKGDFGIPREEWNREVAEYNTIITAYLKYEGVNIHDLYSFLEAHTEYLGENGFFLTEEGAEAVAQEVAGFIRRLLTE